MGGRISWLGVLVRVVAALGVVLLTYNPSGHSFYHWAMRDFADLTALKAFAGALLLVGWVICIRAALTSLGAVGLVLSALVLGTLVWVLTDYGILDPDNPSLLSWISLIIIGIILGIGLSWSLLRTRVTGQVEVD
jgi:drug/metabolite transporter (DMT)-like permease